MAEGQAAGGLGSRAGRLPVASQPPPPQHLFPGQLYLTVPFSCASNESVRSRGLSSSHWAPPLSLGQAVRGCTTGPLHDAPTPQLDAVLGVTRRAPLLLFGPQPQCQPLKVALTAPLPQLKLLSFAFCHITPCDFLHDSSCVFRFPF